MAKWKLTDAGAKRVMVDYMKRSANTGYHQPYACLKQALRAEGLRNYDAPSSMLLWIGENYPKHLAAIAADLSYLYDDLRQKASEFFDAFDSLSNKVNHKAWHVHESPEDE